MQCRAQPRGRRPNPATTTSATNAAKPDSRCPSLRHSRESGSPATSTPLQWKPRRSLGPRLRGDDVKGRLVSPSHSPIFLIPGLPMFFRNLTLFRYPASLDLSDLDEQLAPCTLKPVGGLELSSRGFVSPFGRDAEALSHRIDDATCLPVGGEDKILPAAVVNDLLAKKIAEMEEREGRKPGGRARKRLKEDLVHELLPRAIDTPSRTDAMLDLEHGLCIVDTSSRKSAEAVVSEIRNALG